MFLLKSISNALAYIRDAGDAMSKFEADPSTVSLPDPVWVLDEGGAPTWAEFLETMKVKAFDQYWIISLKAEASCCCYTHAGYP